MPRDVRACRQGRWQHRQDWCVSWLILPCSDHCICPRRLGQETTSHANKGAAAAHDHLDIGLIDAPDYLAYSLCKFKTAGPVKITTKLASDKVTTQLILDPPQPVLSVRCKGMCVGTYSTSLYPSSLPPLPLVSVIL